MIVRGGGSGEQRVGARRVLASAEGEPSLRLAGGPRLGRCFWMFSIFLVSLSMCHLGHAAGNPCDLRAKQDEVFDMLRLDMPLDQIHATLAEALECPRADLDFELNYYQILTSIMRGDIPLARTAARRAARAASAGQSDVDRERSHRLKGLVEENLHAVTFVRPDGSGQGVAVRISKMEELSLPTSEEVRALLPPPLRDLSERLFVKLLESSRQIVAEAESTPFAIWLPAGNYLLSTGQWVPVQGDTTVTIMDLRWARNTTIAALELMSFRPLQPDTMSSSFVAGAGLRVTHRFRLGNSFLLGAGVGIIPARLGLGDAATETDEAQALQAAADLEGGVREWFSHVRLGPSWSVMLSRSMPFLIGVNLGVLSLPDGVRVSGYTNGEGVRVSEARWPTLACFVEPEFTFLYALNGPGQLKGYLMTGLSLGLSVGRFGSGIGSTLGFDASDRFALYPAFQLGGSVAF